MATKPTTVNSSLPVGSPQPVAFIPQVLPPRAFEVLTGQGVPPGQRVLKVITAHGVIMFPMSVQDAQSVGKLLSAPAVTVPTI